MASRVAGMNDILSTLEKLAIYMLTVICGLFIHSLIMLPIVFYVVTRKNPYSFMKGLRDALMTAFGIASRYEAKIVTPVRTHTMSSRGAGLLHKRPPPFTAKSLVSGCVGRSLM